MQSNTHDQKQINLTTTTPPVQGPNPQCDRLLLGIDEHAENLRIIRQLDAAGTQPPQRIHPGATLEAFIKKPLAQTKQELSDPARGTQRLPQHPRLVRVIPINHFLMEQMEAVLSG